MIREIKFRAWSNEHNRYCDFVTLDENGRWIGWIKSSGVYLTIFDIVLEQDTGLKDKNGKEICEGDIVANGTLTSVVEYKVDDFCVWTVGTTTDGIVLLNGNWTVIGNVHENSELLGGKE